MTNYNYQKTLQAVWEKAVKRYGLGNRDVSSYFNEEETDFLRFIGLTSQEVYDFAEDYVIRGEPDFATFALIQDIRRSYFLKVEKGQASEKTLDPESLPDGDTEINGIPWLLRIIQKAKAKLCGELHPDIMYSCGNDRKFLKKHDIHPAEFLRVVWENENDENAIIDWVIERAQVNQPVYA